MCHSRPFEAWNVSTSTPPGVPSSNGLVVATQARKPAPSPSGASRRKSSAAPATLVFDVAAVTARATRRGSVRRGCRAPSARSWDADPSAATWRTTAWSGEPDARVALRRTGDARSRERVGDRGDLDVRADQHADLAGAHERGVARGDEVRDRRASSASSVAVEIGHAGAVAPARRERRRLPAHLEDVQPGLHDLRRAAVVHRQADDLDAGEAGLDVDEQGRIGTVEPVDRLRRIADEEEVVASGAEQIDEPVLERVQVLGLVDQHVAVAPAERVGEVGRRAPTRGSCGRGRRRSRSRPDGA